MLFTLLLALDDALFPLSIHSAPPTDFGRPNEVLSPMLPGEPAEDDEEAEELERLPLAMLLLVLCTGAAPKEAKFQLDENMEDVSPSCTDFGRLLNMLGALMRLSDPCDGLPN